MIFAFTVTAPPGLLRAGAEVRAGIARSAATELESTVSGHFYGMPGRGTSSATGQPTKLLAIPADKGDHYTIVTTRKKTDKD